MVDLDGIRQKMINTSLSPHFFAMLAVLVDLQPRPTNPAVEDIAITPGDRGMVFFKIGGLWKGTDFLGHDLMVNLVKFTEENQLSPDQAQYLVNEVKKRVWAEQHEQ